MRHGQVLSFRRFDPTKLTVDKAKVEDINRSQLFDAFRRERSFVAGGARLRESATPGNLVSAERFRDFSERLSAESHAEHLRGSGLGWTRTLAGGSAVSTKRVIPLHVARGGRRHWKRGSATQEHTWQCLACGSHSRLPSVPPLANSQEEALQQQEELTVGTLRWYS